MIIFGTGHRPEDSNHSYTDMCFRAQDAFNSTSEAITAVVCGMAAGFDLAFGEAAMSLDLPLWTVRPWAGHRPRRDDMDIYSQLERYAVRHIIVNDSLSYPGPWVYQLRNQWMVDNSDAGAAWWNGKKNGGTYNCLVYAKETDTPVTNIYPGKEGLIYV